jgi:hypothetical protein
LCAGAGFLALAGIAVGWLACRGLSSAYRRPSHFSLLAQRKVTKRNGLTRNPMGLKEVTIAWF